MREKAWGWTTINFLCCTVNGCFQELFWLPFYASGAGSLLRKSPPSQKIKFILESPTKALLKVNSGVVESGLL